MARYTPWSKGIYDVAPGLKPLGTDFGNGEEDRRLFQLDAEFPLYRASKVAAIAERIGKYVQRCDLRPDVEAAVLDVFSNELGQRFSDLESAALSVQEDFAIVQVDGDRDSLAYLHLCSPSHWAAEAKIGKSFFTIHEPIPGFERVNAVARGLVDAMVNRGPFVRFVWGVESDNRLNHHPEPPPDFDPRQWHGRNFNDGQFWVRTERQTVWGLPHVNAALFLIRVGHVAGEDVMADDALRSSLVLALKSMSPEARAYKGIDRDWNALMALLRGSQNP